MIKKSLCLIFVFIAAQVFCHAEINNIENVKHFLLEQNRLFRAGERVNYTEISAGIAAIIEFGDSSAFPILFDIVRIDYPEVIRFEAYGAMDFIQGDLFQFLFDMIKEGEPAEKLAAYRLARNSKTLNISQRGRLAELAMEQSFVGFSLDVFYLVEMRYAAVLDLTSLRWTRANALAIRHYYLAKADFQNNLIPKQRFLEAITLLGAVGNSDAALALGLQLGLINANTIRTGTFDAEITLAVIKALGYIGDSSVFHLLLDVSSLPYPENIQAAAREAIERLRW